MVQSNSDVCLIQFRNQKFPTTRRYSQLRGLSFSSSGVLWPLTKAFLCFFLCWVVTSVTFSINHSNFESKNPKQKNPKNPKQNPNKKSKKNAWKIWNGQTFRKSGKRLKNNFFFLSLFSSFIIFLPRKQFYSLSPDSWGD